MRRSIVVFLILSSIASASLAQAPPNTTSALVGYNALKNRVRPAGELRARIDSLDAVIAVASRSGQTAQVRRLIAQGTALLNNRPWTDEDDFRQSLTLRSERVFVDPSRPYVVRLEQTYAPTLALRNALHARASVRPTVAGAAGQGARPMARPLGEFADVGRDLRDMPFRMELDLSRLPDGNHTIEVEVLDSARSLGSALLRVAVMQGLEARLAALEARAASAPAALRADIRYPADYVRKIDRGVIPIGGFDATTEVAAAESIAVVAPAGRDPFAGRTGGFERHYLLEAAGEILPYRVFVPRAYSSASATPLVIALHGLGGTEDSFMDLYDRQVPALAESHGFLVASPLGFRVDGGYGSAIMGPGRRSTLSEQDVMQVLARMRQDYNVDPRRIYLMGHSMGGIGTWHLGAKYPEIWAALGSFAGAGQPASVERMKHLPQFVVHGDADGTVLVARSREMVAEMKRLGVDHRYVEVPGGNHSNVVVPNLAAMFEFFSARRRP